MKNIIYSGCLLFLGLSNTIFSQQNNDSLLNLILTPSENGKPKINAPYNLGFRTGSQVDYYIPVSGTKPLNIEVKGLPAFLQFDKEKQAIIGKALKNGEYVLKIWATNEVNKHKATAEKKIRLIVGKQNCLTPPMGWNSWNCWATGVSEEKILKTARGFVKHRLQDHGWTYINIDDGWQGIRDTGSLALQPVPKKFPDIKKMCDTIHSLGLKTGIYSTPWVRSYAGYMGGSAMNAQGLKDSIFSKKVKPNQHQLPMDCGTYSFAFQDVKQWVNWGIDYLKYDWAPIDYAHVVEMEKAILATDRNIVYSLSNNGPHSLEKNIDSIASHANLWRTDNDIDDQWKNVVRNGFNKDFWILKQSPGHFNDPDMLVIGYVGWGKPHPSRLTPDEQYAHISLWCLMSAPLILGCDMDKMDAFTLNLITNDEVIEIDQDPLCVQAAKVYSKDSADIYVKPLYDGGKAIGIFNRSSKPLSIDATWKDLGIIGKHVFRDLWRQQDKGIFEDSFQCKVSPHGVAFFKVNKKK